MSRQQDRFGRAEKIPGSPGEPDDRHLRQAIENSMESVNLESISEVGSVIPSWEAELGIRMAAVADRLGEDKCVLIAEKSWKQIRRYFLGSQPPASVLKGFADASGVSVSYLLLGTISCSADVEVERAIIDQLVEFLREKADSADSVTAAKINTHVDSLLRRSQSVAERGVEFLDDRDISPEALRQVRGYLQRPPEAKESGVREGFVLVPRFDVAASAGPGAFADSERVIDHMAFREDFVRRVLRADPARLVLITAVGDSMDPAIRAGDLLLVDTGIDHIIDDAIYVVGRRDELVVKRVQRFFTGAVVVRSDNPAYIEETIAPSDAAELRVAGRVRWIGRLI